MQHVFFLKIAGKGAVKVRKFKKVRKLKEKKSFSLLFTRARSLFQKKEKKVRKFKKVQILNLTPILICNQVGRASPYSDEEDDVEREPLSPASRERRRTRRRLPSDDLQTSSSAER